MCCQVRWVNGAIKINVNCVKKTFLWKFAQIFSVL